MACQTQYQPLSQRAYVLMEFMVGLSLVMLLVVILFTTIGKAREAQAIMSQRRAAVYKAESYLATLQVPGQSIDSTKQDSANFVIQPLDEPVTDPRYVWIRVTAKHDGQQASLLGLVCKEYVGAQR